jgi:hypothetical protein
VAGTLSTGSGWFPFYTNPKKLENNSITTMANTGKEITGDCSLKKPKNGLDMGSISICSGNRLHIVIPFRDALSMKF